MRSLALFLLLVGTAASAFEVKRVTVAQLEQEVNALQGKPDAKAAGQLADLQLTERLSAARFAQLQTQIPGSNARQGLLILADTSAFLNLPRAEVPQAPAPDLSTQHRILTQTIHYVARTVRQLPNFSASRVTTRFEDMPQAGMQGETALITYSHLPFHLAGVTNSPVVFRDGQEVIGVAAKSKKNEPAMNGLTTKGEFGPILFTVLLDIAHSTVKWDHWEQTSDKMLAVFAFSVPREQSHYQVGACCLPNDPSHPSQQDSGYHGQIAVDPVTGTVFRIVVQADLKPADPISRADILVEYGPVEIGGRSYICPVRSVAILVDNTVPTPTAQSLRTPRLPPAITGKLHTQTQVDDVAFTQYHLFRAESRMIVEGTSDQQEAPSSSGAAANPVEKPR
jgi:hypothetical protein